MNEEIKNRIISLRQSGCSARGIARKLGIPRYQVAKVLAARERARAEGDGVSGLPRPKQKRASCLDKHLPALRRSGAVCEHHGGAGVPKSFNRRVSPAATTW